MSAFPEAGVTPATMTGGVVTPSAAGMQVGRDERYKSEVLTLSLSPETQSTFLRKFPKINPPMSATNYSPCSTRTLQPLDKSCEVSIQNQEVVGGVRDRAVLIQAHRSISAP